MSDTERLLSGPEAAVVLRISERTLARLVRAGRLPEPLRVGNQRRWRHADLLAAIGAGDRAASRPSCPADESR